MRTGSGKVRAASAAALGILTLAMAAGLSAGRAVAACPGQTQMEMNMCAGQRYEALDAQLNKVYRKLERSPELVAAEKAWIAFRDAQCKFEASAVAGGSMQPMVYADCLSSLTEDRIGQLQDALNQQ